MLNVFENKLKLNKRILLAHSNGALIAMHAIKRLTGCKTGDAVVLSSPFFALQIKIPWWKQALAYTLSYFAPRFRLATGSNTNVLSHKPKLEST